MTEGAGVSEAEEASAVQSIEKGRVHAGFPRDVKEDVAGSAGDKSGTGLTLRVREAVTEEVAVESDQAACWVAR